MGAFTVAMLPMMITRRRIGRAEGAILLLGYAAYMAFLYIDRIAPATGAVVHCKGCGLAYDPDENAARQIAQRAFGPQSADRLNMSRSDAATPAVASQAPEAHLSTESVDNRA